MLLMNFHGKLHFCLFSFQSYCMSSKDLCMSPMDNFRIYIHVFLSFFLTIFNCMAKTDNHILNNFSFFYFTDKNNLKQALNKIWWQKKKLSELSLTVAQTCSLMSKPDTLLQKSRLCSCRDTDMRLLYFWLVAYVFGSCVHEWKERDIGELESGLLIHNYFAQISYWWMMINFSRTLQSHLISTTWRVWKNNYTSLFIRFQDCPAY